MECPRVGVSGLEVFADEPTHAKGEKETIDKVTSISIILKCYIIGQRTPFSPISCSKKRREFWKDRILMQKVISNIEKRACKGNASRELT